MPPTLTITRHSLISLGKVAKRTFPLSTTIPSYSAQAGETFHLIGLLVGLLLWGFALVWFTIAIVMIATTYPFPFNMGWWGFVFPIGKFSPNKNKKEKLNSLPHLAIHAQALFC